MASPTAVFIILMKEQSRQAAALETALLVFCCESVDVYMLIMEYWIIKDTFLVLRYEIFEEPKIK